MKVLAYTSPARGHLFPVMPILLELRARGHGVAVRTLSDLVTHVRDIGLEAEPIDPRIEQIRHDDYRAKTPLGGLKRSATVFTKLPEFEVGDLRAAIAAESPDLLMIDANCWRASAVAEVSGLPWLQWLPYPVPIPGNGVPPFGPGLPRMPGRLGQLRDRALGPVILGPVVRTLRPKLNAVRTSVGAKRVNTLTDIYTVAPLTLYLTAEPFEYPRTDWPASYRLVGPISYDPPTSSPAWLDAIDKPIVLVTTSSEFQDDGRLVATALGALRDEHVFVVATIPAGSPADFDVPPNARVEQFLAHSAILPRAACVITHGGMGATQKALAAGVPVVAVPFGRDQLEVARRVEASGAGVRVPKGTLTPTRLREAVRAATGMSAAAKGLAAQLATAGGARRAADEAEKFAAHSGHRQAVTHGHQELPPPRDSHA